MEHQSNSTYGRKAGRQRQRERERDLCVFPMAQPAKIMQRPSILRTAFALLIATQFAFRGSCHRQADHGVQPERNLYVVYMGGSLEATEELTKASHFNTLSSVISSDDGGQFHVYSYSKSFKGFAAMLTANEASTIAGMPGVVSAFRSRKVKLHTTRSWDLMGLTSLSARNFDLEGDVIVGIIDTGVWPESKSFNDDLLGPIPKKWRGYCETGEQWNASNCKRKLIGARTFNSGAFAEGIRDGRYTSSMAAGSALRGVRAARIADFNSGGFVEATFEDTKLVSDYNSTRDVLGHGTHTASTAAGSVVRGASFYGLAAGDAKGGVPAARIAAYKVIWGGEGTDADFLAAMDAAVYDGVDVLSLSLGVSAFHLFTDSIAIGAFHAIKKGVVVACSARNSGPDLLTAVNVAPWIITVAASTIDRQFYANIVLGNNVTIQILFGRLARP